MFVYFIVMLNCVDNRTIIISQLKDFVHVFSDNCLFYAFIITYILLYYIIFYAFIRQIILVINLLQPVDNYEHQ